MKRLLFIAALALSCSSCAFMNRRNLPLVNLYRKHMVPENSAVRWAMSPVLLPVGLLAGVTDVVLVHPVCVMDDAWFHTAATVWVPTKRGYVTESALFPLRAAATPPLWVSNWLSYTVFDIPRWPPSPARLERDLGDDDAAMRLLAIRDLHRRSYTGGDIAAVSRVMTNACKAWPKDVEFCEAVIGRIPEPLTDEALAALAELARLGRGRRCAAAISRLFRGALYRADPKGTESPDADRALKTLTEVYDALVAGGHHEAEVTIAVLAGYNVRRQRARALALYVTRSLARRNWPNYAEASAFLIQVQLLGHSEAARIEAMGYEWRALRVRPRWPRAVAQAVGRLQSKGSGASRRAFLVRQQNVISERLRKIGSGRPQELLSLTESLVDIKTMLDAEDLAGRLVKGPPEDLRLFMGDPLQLLKARGEP